MAKDVKGTVSASIVDPTTMDMQTALQWCKENINSLKCELIFESVLTDSDDDLLSKETTETNEVFYEVLTTTIE